jgi:hypothetical protein
MQTGAAVRRARLSLARADKSYGVPDEVGLVARPPSSSQGTACSQDPIRLINH